MMAKMMAKMMVKMVMKMTKMQMTEMTNDESDEKDNDDDDYVSDDEAFSMPSTMQEDLLEQVFIIFCDVILCSSGQSKCK